MNLETRPRFLFRYTALASAEWYFYGCLVENSLFTRVSLAERGLRCVIRACVFYTCAIAHSILLALVL